MTSCRRRAIAFTKPSRARSSTAALPPCDHLIRAFRDQAAARIRSMLDEIKADDKARRRMIGQIGGSSVLEEARDLLTILAGRDALAVMADRLPGHIANLADAQLGPARAIIKSGVAAAGELLPFALILIMGRLASPGN